MLVFRRWDVGNNDCLFEVREAPDKELLTKIHAHHLEERGNSLTLADILKGIRDAIRVETGYTWGFALWFAIVA